MKTHLLMTSTNTTAQSEYIRAKNASFPKLALLTSPGSGLSLLDSTVISKKSRQDINTLGMTLPGHRLR